MIVSFCRFINEISSSASFSFFRVLLRDCGRSIVDSGRFYENEGALQSPLLRVPFYRPYSSANIFPNRPSLSCFRSWRRRAQWLSHKMSTVVRNDGKVIANAPIDSRCLLQSKSKYPITRTEQKSGNKNKIFFWDLHRHGTFLYTSLSINSSPVSSDTVSGY